MFKNIFKAADQVDIHSHGFYGGVIGSGWDNGLYHRKYPYGEEGSATASQLASAIASNAAGLNKNAIIRFFGCNCTAIASAVAWNLDKYNRSDITVIGANGSVSPIDKKSGAQHGYQPGNRSFVHDDGGRFDYYKGQKFVGSSKVLEW